MHIIGVACFLVAAKLTVDVDPPTLPECVSNAGNAFTEGDLRRMERIVLSKLEADLSPVTPLMVVQELLAATPDYAYPRPQIRRRTLNSVPENSCMEFDHVEGEREAILQRACHLIQRCAFYYEANPFTPFMQAAAVISMVLEERFGVGLAAAPSQHIYELSGLSKAQVEQCRWTLATCLQRIDPVPAPAGHDEPQWCGL